MYQKRDEQEKYFEQMKCQMNFNTQDCSSEESKTGRLFILFVGLILSSKVRFVWSQSSLLKKKYHSTFDMLHELSNIRYCEYKNSDTHMTSFTDAQVEICKEFNIIVPDECISSNMKKKNKD